MVQTFDCIICAASARVFQGNSAELFGGMQKSLPRLHSGFFNSSWLTSRNIPAPKAPSDGVMSPLLSPKPTLEVTPSPPLSPRSLSKPSRSPASSKPSSPYSQSLDMSKKKKSSTAASSKSKPKKLPSPLLSPKSITKRDTNIPPRKIPKKRLKVAATTNEALIEAPPPFSQSQEAWSPTWQPASPQTGISHPAV